MERKWGDCRISFEPSRVFEIRSNYDAELGDMKGQLYSDCVLHTVKLQRRARQNRNLGQRCDEKNNDVPCIVETISDAVEARQVVLPAGSTVEDTHSVVRIVVSSAGMVVMISEVDVDCVEVVTSSKSVVVGVGVHSAINALRGQAARVGQGGDG